MILTREELTTYILEIIPEITALRHELHRCPELAGKEYRTRARIKEQCDALTPIYWQAKLGTDLVFEIPGRDPGHVTGLRADIDALPLTEETGLEYASQHAGIMHACGHDGHASLLCGAAMIADKFRKYLPHTIRFIFQPGEEEVCMGARLVEEGVCDGLADVYSLHNWIGLPVGSVSSKEGILFAAANEFTVRFLGRGTHGATPEKGNNPLIPAADTAMRLQALHQRYAEEHGAVISVCAIQGGANSNVIPSEAVLQGTVRYIEKELGSEIERAVTEAVRNAAESCAMEYDLQYTRRYHIPVINDPEHTRKLQGAVEKVLGAGAYIPAATHTMGAEDFAFYLDRVPGCMFWLGAGEEQPVIHSSRYDFNDDVLFNGLLVFSSLMFSDNLE